MATACAIRTVRALGASWLAARTRARELPAPARRDLARRCARDALRALGARVRTFGAAPPADEPLLVIANHVSWLDVYALGAHLAARFVAKAETRSWPLVGVVAHRFDSFFLVRGNRRDAHRVKNAVAAALRAGDRVVVFPEATTTLGIASRPFFPAFFQAAVDAGCRIVPVALRYPDARGRPNPAAAFVDDTSFLSSLARIVREPDLRIELHWGAPLDPAGRSRRVLAAAARAWIDGVLAAPAWIEPHVRVGTGHATDLSRPTIQPA